MAFINVRIAGRDIRHEFGPDLESASPAETHRITNKLAKQPCETCSRLTLRSLHDLGAVISSCNCLVGEFVRFGGPGASTPHKWFVRRLFEKEPIFLSLAEPLDSAIRHRQLRIQLGLEGSRLLKVKLADLGGPGLDVSADAGTPAATMITRRVIRSPTSSQTVALIQEWLRSCDEGHEWCCRDVAGSPRPTLPPLPTRVVDLGHADQRPRLRVTNGERGKYVTLSHRWSSLPFLLTRRSNLADLQEKIHLKKLPKTFIDAFDLTKKLGIRYIWIDCLCIVQDDLDDWRQESKRMGAFYEMACFTIAATAATSGHEPFLLESKPDVFEIPCDPASPAEGTFFLTSDPLPQPETHVEQSPLNRRGWVLQERLLSRRVLHFAADQIYWECCEHALSQSGTVFRPRSTVDFLFPLPGLMKNMRNLVRATNDPEEADSGFMQALLTIMEYYSACEFTYEADRLPAIFGLMDRLGPLTSRTYIEGNWFLESSKELPISLLWTACGGAKNRLPEKQRAASWSWVSIEGEVTFHNLRHTVEVELVQILQPHPVENSFTRLRVRGKMVSVHVSREHAEPQSRVFPIVLEKQQQGQADPNGKRAQRFIGNITLDLRTSTTSKVECLYVLTDFTGYPIFLGLEKVSQSEEGLPAYRRVGIGSLRQGTSTAFEDAKDIVLV